MPLIHTTRRDFKGQWQVGLAIHHQRELVPVEKALHRGPPHLGVRIPLFCEGIGIGPGTRGIDPKELIEDPELSNYLSNDIIADIFD